ncbi:MAG: rhomboid family intramembrane serine protease [Nanoarchaeota archaeon]|nr:rhomboid family intramembrane serine protease [Nanoarchaeota archaeon]
MRKTILFRSLSVTSKLIIVNVAVFILALLVSLFISNFTELVALKPIDFIHGINLWAVITSMFMHAGVMHLFFNMFSLWFVGRFAETIIGRRRFLWFYLASGIFAGLVFALLAGFFGNGLGVLVFGSADIAGVGASGAIFGLIGLIAVLTPKNRVYLIAGPLIAIILQAVAEAIFPGSAVMGVLSLIITVYIFVSIFTLFSFNRRTMKIALPLEMPFWLLPFIAIVPLVVIGLFVPLPIGNTAHFGGLVAGLIYGFYLRNKYRKKVKMLNRYFSRE